MDELEAILRRAFDGGDCLALTLSKRRKDAGDHPDKLAVRPVAVAGETAYQFTRRQNGQETHENLNPADARAQVAALFGPVYAHGHLFTSDADYSLRASAGGAVRMHKSRPTKRPSATAHNRAKHYLIADGEPCPFLIEMGVMTAAGHVRSAAQHKFRQINRYLELVNDVYGKLPASGTLHVVDFGCGKSYLTFALHYLLSTIHGRTVRIVGLDRKADVIRHCQQTAERLGCAGLEFRVGDIAGHETRDHVHLAVSLHACDTATDDALAQAIRWQSDVILAVPCCQHELAPRIDSPALAGLLQHGILQERFAALTTDALRAAALELCGYRTQVVEFIDMEHTAKNILLRAVRGKQDEHRRQRYARSYSQLKRAAGLETIYLEQALSACSVDFSPHEKT